MPSRPWNRHPLWTLVARPIAAAIPFALFFAILNQGALRDLPLYYAASLVYSFFINSAIEGNRRWIVPHLARDRDAHEGPLVAVIVSFALASLIASLLAAVALHFTFVPRLLGSPRAVAQVVLFAIVFTALFLGIIYSVRFQRRFVDHVREEAERTARETQEMRVAAEIQQALLPPRSRNDGWYAAAGASLPCRTIGGDFFEYFDLADGRFGFALADVAGKGPPAALLAAMVQGIFDSQARRGAGPAETMRRVNEALAAREIEARFATVFYGVLAPDGSFVCSNAGHNPPLVIRGRDVVRRLEAGGLVIGPFKGARFEEEEARFETGDTLVVYSDGVTDAESESGEQFGEERLLACLAAAEASHAEEVRDRVLGAVREFAGARAPADDVTVLVVRYLGAPRRSPPTS